MESIIERVETFEYNSHWLSHSEKLYAYSLHLWKYTMKSPLPSEEDSALVVSVDEQDMCAQFLAVEWQSQSHLRKINRSW